MVSRVGMIPTASRQFATDLLVQPLGEAAGPDLSPDLLGIRGEGQQAGSSPVEVVVNRGGVGLVVALWCIACRVPGLMEALACLGFGGVN